MITQPVDRGGVMSVTVDPRELGAEVTRLSGLLAGWASVPGDERYAAASLTFNGALERSPVLAVSCATVDDVRRAFESAARLGLPVSVRGGGHSVAGHGVGTGSLLIDLSPLRGVEVDPTARRARVAGGCTWNDVDPATQAHGLAVPGGTFGDTGVGGLTLGGGIGWLIGTGGLTCDNLVRAELVTPAGDVVVAGQDGDADLLWALRGGGGNFGVVTSFDLALHERGPMFGGQVVFKIRDTQEVLNGIAALMHDAPDELVMQPAIRVGRANPQSGCAVMFAYAGPPEDGRRHVDDLRQLATPIDEDYGRMSYQQVQGMNELMPFGLRHYWSGHLLTDLHPETVTAICERLDETQGMNIILFEPISGLARRIDPATAAFPAREARWNVTGMAVWDDHRHDEAQVAWARSISETVLPWSLLGGGYGNYAAHDVPVSRTQTMFGEDRWARLRQVKQTYDPTNLLRYNANITP
jgi:FAD/FMN-containing dehydrogenase